MQLKGKQSSNVWFLMGDSHACADMYTWKPRVQLSTLLKRNKQAVAYAKHMVNNPRAMFLPTPMLLKCGIDFQFMVSHWGQLCMARQLCIEPPCMAVPHIETQ